MIVLWPLLRKLPERVRIVVGALLGVAGLALIALSVIGIIDVPITGAVVWLLGAFSVVSVVRERRRRAGVEPLVGARRWGDLVNR